MEKKRTLKGFMISIPEIAALMENGKLNQETERHLLYTVLNKYPKEFNSITGIDESDIEFIGRGDDVVDNIRYILDNF